MACQGVAENLKHFGLIQVTNVHGQFVSATPMKGTVLVNIADLMQRWTADKLKSTVCCQMKDVK